MPLYLQFVPSSKIEYICRSLVGVILSLKKTKAFHFNDYQIKTSNYSTTR